MNISETFIRRPVMTTLLMLSILLFGISAYRHLPVSDLPNVDYPTLWVMASLPGASPETMASAVATPLERQFSTISGLESMSSASNLGNTSITLQFDLSKDIDVAAQDVQSAISTAARYLPEGMPTPPYYRKVNPADQPILYLALMSPTLPLYELNEYGETMMAQRISMVSGVAQVMVYGSQKYAVRIQLDPWALANRGIGIDEVERAVQGANVTGCKREPSHRNPAGAEPGIYRQGEWTTHGGFGLPPCHCGLQERRTRSAGRSGQGHRQRRKYRDRSMVHQSTVCHSCDSTPARDEHRGGGRSGQEADSAVRGGGARFSVSSRAL